MEIFLSSAKKYYGLRELLSANLVEFWSTDDSLPHSITIDFPEKTYVYSIILNFMYFEDESYTPERLTVYYKKDQGKVCIHNQQKQISFESLMQTTITQNKPQFDSFKEIKLLYKEPNGDKEIIINDIVRTLYVVINSNHSDGKDSHVRRLRVMKSSSEQFYYDESMLEVKDYSESDEYLSY